MTFIRLITYQDLQEKGKPFGEPNRAKVHRLARASPIKPSSKSLPPFTVYENPLINTIERFETKRKGPGFFFFFFNFFFLSPTFFFFFFFS
jgi:hypothetical protein